MTGFRIQLGTLLLVVISAPLLAHHGTGISYDLEHPWMTKATVTEFRYANPHPQLYFDRVDDKGNVEHWVSELQNNPSMMIREGWTKSRSMEAMKPGTIVTLYLCTAKTGGFSAVVRRIQNEKGEDILVGGIVGPPRDQRGGAQ
jgi:uncharacterized protein DUF6152